MMTNGVGERVGVGGDVMIGGGGRVGVALGLISGFVGSVDKSAVGLPSSNVFSEPVGLLFISCSHPANPKSNVRQNVAHRKMCFLSRGIRGIDRRC